VNVVYAGGCANARAEGPFVNPRVLAKCADRDLCQLDASPALGGLGCFYPPVEHGALDLESSGSKINVLPTKPQKLPRVHPGGKRQDVKDPQPMPFANLEDPPDLPFVQRIYLPISGFRGFHGLRSVPRDELPSHGLLDCIVQGSVDDLHRPGRETGIELRPNRAILLVLATIAAMVAAMLVSQSAAFAQATTTQPIEEAVQDTGYQGRFSWQSVPPMPRIPRPPMGSER
jgi:hypothetical protein